MLSIGQLSDATGVPTSTLRFWERKGLLAANARQGGQRRYDEDALTRVALLRLCQDAGWTLAEIGHIVRDDAPRSPDWRDFVRTKMASLEEDIARLRHAHQMLSHVLECPLPDITQCPKFLEALEHRKGAARPAFDSELAAGLHSGGDPAFGDEGQERDRAGEHDRQRAQH